MEGKPLARSFLLRSPKWQAHSSGPKRKMTGWTFLPKQRQSATTSRPSWTVATDCRCLPKVCMELGGHYSQENIAIQQTTRRHFLTCGLLGRAKCGRHGQVAAGNFRRGSRSPEATLFLFIYPNFSWSNSPVDRLPLLLKLLANETMNFTVLAHSYFVGQCPAVRVEYWRRHRYMVLDAQCPASHSMKYLGSPESTPTRS